MAEENVATKGEFQVMEEMVSVSGSTAKLCLSERTLYYEIQSEKKSEILLEDLIGVQVQTDPNTNINCKLIVHYFPVVSKRRKRNQRKLHQFSVIFDQKEDQKDNLKVATVWKTNILLQAERLMKITFEYGDRSTRNLCSVAVDSEDVSQSRNILVILNPYAGDQNGEAKFNKVIKPMFDLAELNYTVVKTKHQNHAHDMVQELDLAKYGGIVVASGDGLLYEIINGIMKRPDWETAIKMPMGMLPVGSGNGLAASTLYEAGEEFSLEAAAFLIIRGGLTPMDMATVETCDGNRCYMTIVASWGMVADVDILSESMRKIGETRFTIEFFKQVARKKVYRGKLSYLPCDADDQVVNRIIPSSIMQAIREGHGNFVSPHSSFSSVNWQELRVDGDQNPEFSLNRNTSENDEVEDLEVSCSGKPSDENAAGNHGITKVEAVSALCAEELPDRTECSSQRERLGPSTDLLVPLNESLPDSWKICSEEEFLTITPLLIPHMNRNSFGDPKFQIGSKEFRLMCVKGSTSRWNAIKIFVNTKTGEHVEMEDVYMIPAKAFRIEPINGGIVTIDGEKMETGPFQAQIHPHMAFLMSRKRL